MKTTDLAENRSLRRAARWIAERELWCLAILSLPLLFPRFLPPLTFLALAVIPMLWVARWIARGRLTRAVWLDLPIIGLLIMLAISLFVAPDPQLAFSKASVMALGIALYYGLANHVDPLPVLGLTPWLSWAIMLLGLVGIDWMSLKIPALAPIYGFLPRLIRGVPRTMQGGFHPNEVAGTLAMLWPLIAAWRLAGPRARLATAQWPIWLRHLDRWAHSRVFFWLTMIIMGGFLVLTQSRTALVAAASVLWLLGALRWRRWGWLTVALVAILAVALAVVGPQSALDRVLTLLPSSYTWSGRPELWRNAWQAMLDHPLTGVGLNHFTPVSRARYVYLIAQPPWDFVHAHNILLQIGVDYGWPGLICFLASVAGFWILAYRTAKRADMGQRWVLIGAVSSMAGYLIFGSIDAITLGAKPSLLWWVAAGLIAQLALADRPAPLKRPIWQPISLVAVVTCAAMGFAWIPPLNSVWHHNMGYVMLNQQDFPAAVDRFQRALIADCRNLAARRGLAEAHAMMGEGELALSIGVAAGLTPSYWSDRGASWYDQGEIERALAWQRWALTRAPDLADAWYRLSLVYDKLGKEADAHLALARAVDAVRHVTVSPTVIMRHYLGLRLLSEPSWFSHADKPSGYLGPLERRAIKANQLYDDGQVAEAIAEAEAVLAQDETVHEAWTLLGKVYMRQRDDDRAILAFERAVALAPSQYWPRHLLAMIHARRMEWERVVALEGAIWQQSPTAQAATESALKLLEAYEALDDPVGACRMIEQIADWLDDEALRERLIYLWRCE